MSWIKKALTYMRDFEPAMLKTIWIALLALLSAAGVILSPAIENKANAWIGAIVILISVLQGLWTRSAVYAPAVIQHLEDVYSIPAVGTSTADVKAYNEAPNQGLVQDDDSDVLPFEDEQP